MDLTLYYRDGAVEWRMEARTYAVDQHLGLEMPTQVSLRYRHDVPSDVAIPFKLHVHVSGSEVSIFDIESAPLDAILETLLKLEQRPIFGPYFAPSAFSNYQSPQLVGVVLGPGEVQGCDNPDSDFAVSWHHPCGGIVKEGALLRCRYKPPSHVEEIGNHVVISSPLRRLLNIEASLVDSHGVSFRDQVLEGWYGIKVTSVCSVIDHDCFAPTTECALCGSSYTPWRGVWIAKPNTELFGTIHSDESGYEHDQTRHPIIVSREVAVMIRKSLGHRGYSLEPVYSCESDFGKLAKQVIRCFKN
jgi:hypothetical protein